MLVENNKDLLKKCLNKLIPQLKSLEELNRILDNTLCKNKKEHKKNKKTSNLVKENLKNGLEGMEKVIFQHFSFSQLISAKKDLYTEILMLTDKISKLREDIKTEKLRLKKIKKELKLLQAKWKREIFLQSQENKTLLEKEKLTQTKQIEFENVIRLVKKNGFSFMIKSVDRISSLYTLYSFAKSTVLPYFNRTY